MDQMELRIHRANTTAFIAVKPSTIVLQSIETKERTKSGGFKRIQGGPREPQVFRLIELSGTNIPIQQATDGEQREEEFQLLGDWDAQVELDDWWMADDGRSWRIREIKRSNQYEVRAMVVERGV